MLGAGAAINALAFSGSNWMFHQLSSSDEERKRHDLAIENEQKARNSWLKRRQEEFDAERKRREQAKSAEYNLQELDASMLEYAQAWEAANPRPQFNQFYHPSEQQKGKDRLGALVAVAVVGGAAWYFL